MKIDKLHYISQALPGRTHLTTIGKVLEAGVKWIQLRVKDLPEAEILELALAARMLCDAFGARLIVNDHPHIALLAKADGVHLGLTDLPVPEARKILGRESIIGGTANTFEDVLLRVKEGADYIGLGPFRFTMTKKNLSPVIGPEGYRLLMERAADAGIVVPVLAIGGITAADVPGLLRTGVYGVAISGALTFAEDLAMEAQKLRSMIANEPG